MSKFNQKITVLSLCLAMHTATYASLSIAEISSHLMGPTQGFVAFITAVACVAGVGLLIGSLIQYRDYRKNKGQVRLSTPITFFFLGLFMILLPLISQYSAGAQYLMHSIGAAQVSG